MRAFVFPGQGKSVTVGMGLDLALNFLEAKEVFQEVDNTLNQHLFKLMSEGPIEELTLTENAQPALMALGVALGRVLEKQSGKPLTYFGQFGAGHSLGEYSSLTVFDMFTLQDAARILKKRGIAMQQAVKPGVGAMAALLGTALDIETIQKLCAKAQKYGVCEISNDNAPNQIVISGNEEAIDAAITFAPEYGIRRAIMLPVSAPFHCSLMAPAAKEMQKVLETIECKKPLLPLISNVTADKVSNPTEICDLLVKQVTQTVRWRECVQKLASLGVTETIEMGSGKVLSGLIKTIHPDMRLWSLEEPKDIEFFIENYQKENV